ncbi:MAG: MBL fold metallo-hydrolase [Chitinivibrionales bacterium]|nr:MBL fold metallo-hydrolase [Chitinivibrionales bacterium]
MPPVPITDNIYWIGVNDRTTDLFEGLWPISQEGVSYNSYLINDTKKVVIDLAKSIKTDDYLAQIADIVPLSELDYVVLNHMEPDHTGILRTLRRIAPSVTILATPKAMPMLKSFYGVTDNVREVADGETLDIGQRKLVFVHTPFVHWPETMMTYEPQAQVLFSCDGFGGYGALRGAIFDDECTDKVFYERESLRYYANIVAKFHVSVLKAIDKLADTPVRIIAPSHGLVWREHPERIIELYRTWSEYGRSGGTAGATLVYGSMYGNTEAVMNAVGQGLSAEGVAFEIFDAARTHASYILPSLYVHKGVVVGAPTYEGALFPPVADALNLAATKAVRNKRAAFFGSFGWSGGAEREFKKIAEGAKWEVASTFPFPGGPSTEVLSHAYEFGRTFAQSMS